ncbi:MAG: BLUF domain-containing protein [Burkholderiaceae bacterium]
MDATNLTKTSTGAESDAPEENLTCIAYVSRAANALEWAFDADSIAEYSRVTGLKTRITGLMVVQNGYYFQALEGEKKPILRLFDKIQQDPRHVDLALLHMEDIKARSFPNWSKISARRNESPEDTAARISAVVERLTNLAGVSALDIFRALFVPSVHAIPLQQSDKRVWRIAFLSPSGLWSANIIQYFGRQMQQRVGRTWLGDSTSEDEGSLVEYVDFDDTDLGHVRAVSFYNDAVANPALVGIMENAAIVVVLLNSNEINEGESYIAKLLEHPVVDRYHPVVLLISSHEARLDELMNSTLVSDSGLIFRSATLRVSDSPAIWRQTFMVGEELGQIGGVEQSDLAALSAGVDQVEEGLMSSDLTATSVTAVMAARRYLEIFEPLRRDGSPAGGEPKSKDEGKQKNP